MLNTLPRWDLLYKVLFYNSLSLSLSSLSVSVSPSLPPSLPSSLPPSLALMLSKHLAGLQFEQDPARASFRANELLEAGLAIDK